jgi:ABC-2 type transport system ATP-binding protein
MSISAQNIIKTFGNQNALDDVSFEIESGKIVGFIGPNGAGKSTMMRIITGYLHQTSGKVNVNGLAVDENPVEVKKHIGFLPENNPLYPEMYVKEYLFFVAGMHKVANKNLRVNEVIEMTGITPEKHKKIGALSKGYRQRIGLAQALIHNPDVLILDEPTTGLDPNQIIEIRNLISEIGKQKTVLLSTHIMQEVEAICHRVIIINKGKIVMNDQTSNINNYSDISKQIILIEFQTAVPEKMLMQVNGVEKVVKVKDNLLLIEASGDKDIRNELFQFAVKNSIAILSMMKKEKSLQEVFNELTK